MTLSENPTVTLREVTADNARDIMRLNVAEDQQQLVADNVRSFAQAHFEPYAWYRGIYADETPVGFVMLYDNPDKPVYFLWRLMIDERYQGRGFGYQAVEQVIEYVKTRPGAKELLVSYVPNEGNPGPFYRRLSFEDTGKEEHGEKVMRLELEGVEAAPPPARPLTHIVLFRLKDSSEDNRAAVSDKLLTMRGRIPTLRHIEAGYDVVRAQRSYDIALVTKFDDLAGMEAYQVHPVHKEIVAYMHDVAESAVAVDFES